MTLSEFQEKIEQCRILLSKKVLYPIHYRSTYPSLCHILHCVFSNSKSVRIEYSEDHFPYNFDIQKLFLSFFRPSYIDKEFFFYDKKEEDAYDRNTVFWLGNLTKSRIKTRLLYLDMFEAWFISFEYYEQL